MQKRSMTTKTMKQSTEATYSAESVVHSVIAGYSAGITGCLVGHPLDSAKVWLQTNTRGAGTSALPLSASQPQHTPSSAASAGSTTRQMSTLSHPAAPRPTSGWNLRTLRSLYAGIGGPLVTVGMIQSINFAIYDSVRRILHRKDFPDAPSTHYLDHDSLSHVTISSMVAGSVLAVFTSPFSVIKTKQQIMQWNFRKTVRDTLRQQHGSPSRLRNFYVGFGPHFLAETFGRGVYFFTYEGLKRVILQRKRQMYGGDESKVVLSLQERMLSAASAGITCWSLIFPLDALRSRIYAQSLSVENPKTTWQLAKSMYQESQSLRPFFRGFGVTVLRAGPVAAAVLPVYDTTLEWLSQQE